MQALPCGSHCFCCHKQTLIVVCCTAKCAAILQGFEQDTEGALSGEAMEPDSKAQHGAVKDGEGRILLTTGTASSSRCVLAGWNASCASSASAGTGVHTRSRTDVSSNTSLADSLWGSKTRYTSENVFFQSSSHALSPQVWGSFVQLIHLCLKGRTSRKQPCFLKIAAKMRFQPSKRSALAKQ